MSLFPRPWGNYLLEDFIETQAPEPISWIPQTIGWHVVLLFILYFVTKKVVREYLKYKRNAYRREAMSWLSSLAAKPSSNQLAQMGQLPALLRKTAIIASGREEVASLTGKEWENWLDKRCTKTSFANDCKGLINKLAYTDGSEVSKTDTEKLQKHIGLWVKHHRGQYD